MHVIPDPPPSRRLWTVAGVTALLAISLAFFLWPEAPLLPKDPRARTLFLEAEHLTATWETDKVIEATKRYDEVTRVEPDFAPAWAGWTNADVVLATAGPSPEASIRNAEAHARRALSLNDSLAVAHAALGHSYWQEWKCPEAEAEFQKALAGKGDRATTHQLYALYLASLGRKDEAVSFARRALDAQPASGLFNYSLAQVYFQSGDFDAAIAAAQITQTMDRAFPNAFQTLLRANIQLGRLDEAQRALEEQARYFPKNTGGAWPAYLLAKQGKLEEARTIFRELAFKPEEPVPQPWACGGPDRDGRTRGRARFFAPLRRRTRPQHAVDLDLARAQAAPLQPSLSGDRQSGAASTMRLYWYIKHF